MNFRFAFCAAIMVLLSIILSCTIFVSQKMKFALILIFAGLFLLFLISFAFFKKRFLIILMAIIFIGVIPVVSIYFKAEHLNKNRILISDKNTFYGKISNFSEELDRNAVILELSNVEIIVENEKKSFEGKVYVHLVADGFDVSKLNVGGFVTIFDSSLESLTLNEGANARGFSYLSKGVSAKSLVFAYNLRVEDKISLSFRDKVKNSIFETFDKTSNTFFTNIGYAMLFGESSVLSDDIYDVLKDSGIAHLLAVSGFNISIIVSVLVLILNKLKANKYVKIVVVSLVLAFYAYFCSFSVSVLRASVMAILLLFSSNRNKEYDKLSSLSLSLVLILLISPMQMFNISFIFSFVSILSIILLSPIFERLFSKFLSEKLSSSISVTLAASLGISVFQLYYFGSYPILGIFSNIITIPLVSFLFIFLLISVLMGPIFGITIQLIEIFGSCMKYIVQFNSFIAKNGLYIVCGEFNAIVLALTLLVMLLVSDFVFIKKRIKLPIAGALFIAMVLVMI